MKYENIKKAVFKERLNRFVSIVKIGGENFKCHVKNTGRCGELLVDGAEVYVQMFDKDSQRKTLCDLITVRKGNTLFNIDSQAPNNVFYEYVNEKYGGNIKIKREVKFGNSRFDFYVEDGERKIFIEVKGVTLEEEGILKFPDAPTERGLKHINELCGCLNFGYEAYVIFVIQMSGAKKFVPNYKTHPEFGRALVKANEKGVKIFALECDVKADEIRLRGKSVEVNLDEN